MLAGLVLAASLSSCQGPSGAERAAGRRSLTVFAASSLARVFPRIASLLSASRPGLAVRFQFAGTDVLATQLEQGAAADLFADASVQLANRLFAEGIIAAPVPFASNHLVLVVPRSNPAGLHGPGDLRRQVKLVVAGSSVPLGTYTREALERLDGLYGQGYARTVLSRVVSEEASAEAVLSKVRLGEADAGFVYRTDAQAAGADVLTFPLPEGVDPMASYHIATVRGSRNGPDASAFVRFVVGPQGQRTLGAAGFGPPAGGP